MFYVLLIHSNYVKIKSCEGYKDQGEHLKYVMLITFIL